MKPVSFLTTRQKLVRISQTAMARQQFGLWRVPPPVISQAEMEQFKTAVIKTEE